MASKCILINSWSHFTFGFDLPVSCGTVLVLRNCHQLYIGLWWLSKIIWNALYIYQGEATKISLESKRTRPVEKSSTPTAPNLYLEIGSAKHLQQHWKELDQFTLLNTANWNWPCVSNISKITECNQPRKKPVITMRVQECARIWGQIFLLDWKETLIYCKCRTHSHLV